MRDRKRSIRIDPLENESFSDGSFDSAKNRILLIHPYSIDFINLLSYNERVEMMLRNT